MTHTAIKTPPKPGWKTTEFWMTVTGEVGLTLAAVAGVLPPKWSAVLMVGAGAAYKISRGLSKLGGS